MANILDYINWFQDIPLESVELNELDALIFAQLSYVNFTDIIPTSETHKSISVKDASEKFFSIYDKQDLYNARGLISPYTPFILQKMAKGRRYKNLELSNLKSVVDSTTHEQLAAFCITLPQNTTFISFRGTDGTITGWREDFMMSFKEVPAQVDSLKYLEDVASKTDGKIMLAGHSKGGNLAAYAATMASTQTQKRIEAVWCMDSPGFDYSVIPEDKLMCISDKIRLYVPEFCLVGALMHQQTKPCVIKSDQTGVLQHDAMSWQCMGTKFIYTDKCSDASLKVQQEIEQISNSVDASGKEKLNDAIFDALQATGAHKLGDLLNCTKDDYKKLFEQLENIESDQVDTILKLISSLFFFSVSSAIAPLQQMVSQAKNSRHQNKEEEVSAEGLKQYRETKLLKDFQSSITKIFSKQEKDNEENIVKKEPIQ